MHLIKKKTFLTVSIVLIGFLLSSCKSIPSTLERNKNAKQHAEQVNWVAETMESKQFNLQLYRPQELVASKHLTLYIEGDGLAWLSQTSISPDPTPTDPIGLRLGIQQADRKAIYLARPCQFITQSSCSNRYWTSARFATEVITAYDQIINQLKRRYSIKNFSIVGYSGGAAIAALIAARRDDITHLISVAGNLDHKAWSEHHKISPLDESLNPADYAKQLAAIQQHHFIGKQDKVIPQKVINSYIDSFTGINKQYVHVIESFDHRCCWAEAWPELIKQIQKKTNSNH